MIRQYLLILLLSCWMVSPSHAEETYDASILDELQANETAKKEADADNASNEVPTGSGESLENTQNGSGIIKADFEKNDLSDGGLNAPNNEPLAPTAEYNQIPEEDAANAEESTDVTENSGDNQVVDPVVEDVVAEETPTGTQTDTAASSTTENVDTPADNTTQITSENSTNPVVNNASNIGETDSGQTESNATQTQTAADSNVTTDPVTNNGSSNSSTANTATSSNNTSNGSTTAVVNVPSQPIIPVNPEFADHWIDTRPQTAVIIELEQDVDDDERFFYLYSDITNQAGYSIDTGNGTVVYNGDGTITYTAKAGFSGTDTFFYAYDGWDYGRGGYGRGSRIKAYGYGWQDYGYGSRYGKGWGYGASDSEVAEKSRRYSKRKRKAKSRVSRHLGSPIGPAICQIYAVHDEGASDSQFVKFEVIDLKEKRTRTQKIGIEYPGFDIEAIAIHPITAMLYAASDDLLYLVHPSEASLKVVGEIGYDEITGFAFHPKDSTLFAATDTDEVDKSKGILQVDPDSGTSKMILPSSYAIEALAWNLDGTILYAAEKTKRPNEYGVMVKSSNLIAWYYDGKRLLGKGFEAPTDSSEQAPTSTRSTRSDRNNNVRASSDDQVLPDSGVDFLRLGLNVVGSADAGKNIEINAETGAGGDSPFTICEGFGDIDGEVESLETRADGMLLFSVDNKIGDGNKIYAFNPETCKVQEETSFGTPYSDIEAIAWPIHCQSSTVPVPKGWDINFIGNNSAFCVEEGKPFEIKGKVSLASKGFLNLKTSWEIVAPENAKCPQIGEESGLANPEIIDNCPTKALKNSQMLTGNSDFNITAWWPGLTDIAGNDHQTVEVRFTAELFDMLGNPMSDYAPNTIENGTSIATRSMIATAEVCGFSGSLSPAQLLNDFFINDYAIESDAFNLGKGILTVRIDGQVYSGRITDAMLAAIEQGSPSSSFLDKNKDGIDDLILVYADGSKQTLFAQIKSEVKSASEEKEEPVLEEVAQSDVKAIDAEQEAPETKEVDFSEYVAKFNSYLQQILSQGEYEFDTDGLLSLVLNDAEHLGQLSEQPIDAVEPFEGNIIFGELAQDEKGLPYFPITFQDGQVFALYYLGESDNEAEQSDENTASDDTVVESADTEEDSNDSGESSNETSELEEDVFDGESLDDESGSDDSASTEEETTHNTDDSVDDEESEDKIKEADGEGNSDEDIDAEQGNDES
ncbi:hypothetical protein [Candidatus Albibeggiatoa sp. nov. NOAA]|uniref:Ig-like domain-containing protein n=1 Tax=Candidatus Albibeggiatoa sp. nov. NOAA TaxID=3162724 RepID=UPI003302ADE4|nr:hypothetical protein [Thiotrichaceae bacterium]